MRLSQSRSSAIFLCLLLGCLLAVGGGEARGHNSALTKDTQTEHHTLNQLRTESPTSNDTVPPPIDGNSTTPTPLKTESPTSDEPVPPPPPPIDGNNTTPLKTESPTFNDTRNEGPTTPPDIEGGNLPTKSPTINNGFVPPTPPPSSTITPPTSITGAPTTEPPTSPGKTRPPTIGKETEFPGSDSDAKAETGFIAATETIAICFAGAIVLLIGSSLVALKRKGTAENSDNIVKFPRFFNGLVDRKGLSRYGQGDVKLEMDSNSTFVSDVGSSTVLDVVVTTPLFDVYYRNERNNIQCFPCCKEWGEYSKGKLAGHEHVKFKRGTCAGSIQATAFVSPSCFGQNFDDAKFVFLGRICSDRSPPPPAIGTTMTATELKQLQVGGKDNVYVRADWTMPEYHGTNAELKMSFEAQSQWRFCGRIGKKLHAKFEIVAFVRHTEPSRSNNGPNVPRSSSAGNGNNGSYSPESSGAPGSGSSIAPQLLQSLPVKREDVDEHDSLQIPEPDNTSLLLLDESGCINLSSKGPLLSAPSNESLNLETPRSRQDSLEFPLNVLDLDHNTTYNTEGATHSVLELPDAANPIQLLPDTVHSIPQLPDTEYNSEFSTHMPDFDKQNSGLSPEEQASLDDVFAAVNKDVDLEFAPNPAESARKNSSGSNSSYGAPTADSQYNPVYQVCGIFHSANFRFATTKSLKAPSSSSSTSGNSNSPSDSTVTDEATSPEPSMDYTLSTI